MFILRDLAALPNIRPSSSWTAKAYRGAMSTTGRILGWILPGILCCGGCATPALVESSEATANQVEADDTLPGDAAIRSNSPSETGPSRRGDHRRSGAEVGYPGGAGHPIGRDFPRRLCRDESSDGAGLGRPGTVKSGGGRYSGAGGRAGSLFPRVPGNSEFRHVTCVPVGERRDHTIVTSGDLRIH